MSRLSFKKDRDFEDEPICRVYNSAGEELGFICIDDEWNKSVWRQNKDVIMASDCLDELIKKMREWRG